MGHSRCCAEDGLSGARVQGNQLGGCDSYPSKGMTVAQTSVEAINVMRKAEKGLDSGCMFVEPAGSADGLGVGGCWSISCF